MDVTGQALDLLAAAGNADETKRRIGAMEAAQKSLDEATARHGAALAALNAKSDAVKKEAETLRAEQAAFSIENTKAKADIADRYARLEAEELRVNELRAMVDRQKGEQKNEADRLQAWDNELRAEVHRQRTEAEDLHRKRANLETVARAVAAAIAQLETA